MLYGHHTREGHGPEKVEEKRPRNTLHTRLLAPTQHGLEIHRAAHDELTRAAHQRARGWGHREHVFQEVRPDRRLHRVCNLRIIGRLRIMVPGRS